MDLTLTTQTSHFEELSRCSCPNRESRQWAEAVINNSSILTRQILMHVTINEIWELWQKNRQIMFTVCFYCLIKSSVNVSNFLKHSHLWFFMEEIVMQVLNDRNVWTTVSARECEHKNSKSDFFPLRNSEFLSHNYIAVI